MFCKTCGSILMPKTTPYGKWMSCPKGHSQPKMIEKSKSLKSENLNQALEVKVSDGVNILAVHNHDCEKCGHDKAELIEVQPFYSDEDPFLRMKCGKCGATKRLEGKLG